MFLDHILHLALVFLCHPLEINHVFVAKSLQVILRVEDVGNPTAHTRGKIPSGFAKHNNTATGHILTRVIADTLDDRADAGVSHAETLTRLAPDIGFAGCGTIKGHVTDDYVVFRFESCFTVRIDDEFSSRKSFSKIIVRFTFQLETEARSYECPEAMARRTFESEVHCIFRKSFRFMLLGNFIRQKRPY